MVPSKNTAYICWGGAEYAKTHYDILVGQHYGWVPCFSGRVPPNAVRTGNTSTGEPLYIGRGRWEGSLTVGKIHSSHGCLYIPFGGQEHRLDSYEVLVSNFQTPPVSIYPTQPQVEIAGLGGLQHDSMLSYFSTFFYIKDCFIHYFRLQMDSFIIELEYSS